MTAILYGIPNCDTIKKARKWLDERGIAYSFHDYKKAGIDEVALRSWVKELGWEVLLNKAGTTFRKLPEASRADLDVNRAIEIMMDNPSVIKRPIMEYGDRLLAGFKPDDWATANLPKI